LFQVAFPAPVVGDNKSALATASVPSTKAGRHINLREHWIRDVLELGDLVIGFIPGEKNVANLGTKVLNGIQFTRESLWMLRGIHSNLYQQEISGALREIWSRIFSWNQQMAVKEARQQEAKALTQASPKKKQKGGIDEA
jgi:hypothetical protein